MDLFEGGSEVNPICPKCRLENIIFEWHKLPLRCNYCGADLIKKEKQNEGSH
jgi:ribosomal protein S27E